MDYLTDEDYQTALSNGISKQNAYQRVYDYGWEIEKAITTPVRQYANTYPQYKEQCQKIGLGERGFYNRLERGMSPEEAATTPKQDSSENLKRTRNHQNQLITKEQEQLALEHGIKRKTVVARLRRGWNMIEALTVPVGTYLKGRHKQDEQWAYIHFKKGGKGNERSRSITL